MNAKQSAVSQQAAVSDIPFQHLSTALGEERSNSAVWVPPPGSYCDLPLIVGIDSEWTREGDGNRILSYQFFACDLAGRVCWRGLYHVQNKRYSFGQVLSCAVMQGLQSGAIAKWPTRLCVVAHFALADLAAFRDFQRFKTAFQAVRGTLISARKLKCILWDQSRHQHEVELTLRDSMLLAPTHSRSLEALGRQLGVKKIELAPGEIERMDKLLAENPDLFEAYALRDPEIAVRYLVRMMRLNYEATGRFEEPSTLSNIGLRRLLQCWRESGIDRHAVLGTEAHTERVWVQSAGRYHTRKSDVPVSRRHMYESFATECFHGGRNEQYFFGAGVEGVWSDFDLRGAYTTAMCCIGMPRWNEIRSCHDLDMFQPTTMGFARVRFRFPENTRFPCLPVRTEHGLIFPLSGESCCCAPEIYLAIRMGAQVEILDGIILPTEEGRPFEPFVIDCTHRRNAAQTDLDNLLWKEVGNSVYGKLAQGLAKKRCYDLRSDGYRELPPSEITNPFLAAYTTSVIRAVLGEALSRLPLHAHVCSATTDGFLTTATESEVDQALEGPLCGMFAAVRLRIVGDPQIVDVKKRIAQPLGWRTRGQATLKAIPGEKIVLAKAGLKPPGQDEQNENEWIVNQFTARTAESKYSLSVLRSLPEICRRGGDLVKTEITRALAMDYDLKRRPVNAGSRDVHGVPHLYFDTKPWPTKDQFDEYRARWDECRGAGAVMKTSEALADFEERVVIKRGRSRVRCSKQKPAETNAKRMVLRAYTRSMWGLDARQMSYSEIAVWLTQGGFPTSKSDVENAARKASVLQEHAVPLTPVVAKMIGLVKKKFPCFEADRLLLLQPSEIAAVTPQDGHPQ